MIDSKQKSISMSKVRTKNTKPELLVRSKLHKMGYRFRIHQSNLPGTPDIVLKKFNIVIFVHGCFWHQHLGCRKAIRPKTRQEFWNKKLDRNISRDNETNLSLNKLGWKVIIIWECEALNENTLIQAINSQFDNA